MTYTERLHVPLRWWAQGTMLIATFWLAMIVSMPGALAWPLTAVMVLILAGAFLSYGSAVVQVADGELKAGRAHIPTALLGEATALDADQTRLTAGRDANARAFLLLRPYLKRSLKVTVEDPADPTPYWLISTRHPDLLAAAIDQSRSATPRHG